MNINATLIGQAIAFFLFVVFCMKYVWPPILHALEARKAKIADGLAAAEHGKHAQELAEARARELLREAKDQGAEVISRADKRAAEIIEAARDDAKSEGQRLMTAAQAEIEQEVVRVKEDLRGQVVSIALAGAGRILEREVDEAAHAELMNKLVAEI